MTMNNFYQWLKHDSLNESNQRYSVEVNYRTKTSEVLDYAAKIILGYISAAIKKLGYHTKKIFDDEPYRLIISTRCWDDGEWVGVVSWNPHHKAFVLAKGIYNKPRKKVIIKEHEICDLESASEIAKKVSQIMNELKERKNYHIEKLKPVPLKRGPKS